MTAEVRKQIGKEDASILARRRAALYVGANTGDQMNTRINWLGSRKSNCNALLSNTLVAKEILRVLANESRLKILCCLVEGERSVCQIMTFAKLKQPTVSQHLALLRAKGLVESRRDGKAIYYSLTNFPTRIVLESLDELFELRVLTRIPQSE